MLHEHVHNLRIGSAAACIMPYEIGKRRNFDLVDESINMLVKSTMRSRTADKSPIKFCNKMDKISVQITDQKPLKERIKEEERKSVMY